MTNLIIDDAHIAISKKAFVAENTVLRELADNCPHYEKLLPKITANATALVEKLRKEGAGHGVEAFLQEYGLDTQEGIAIMCLAEALLRIPDSHTADELIRDKFEGKNWDKHIGKSDSLLVNASSWGLVLTGKIVDYTENKDDKASNILKKLVSRVGEPTVREAMRQAVKYIGTQFVMGTDINEAMHRARPAQKKGYSLSYDILGEGARTQKQADIYFNAYMDAINAIANHKSNNPPSLSIKLSALHPKYYLAKRNRLEKELLPRLKHLVAKARDANLMVAIDAEESYRLDIHMLLFRALREDKQFAGYDGIGFVLQAYGKRAFYIVDWLQKLAQETDSRIPVRLVKGAYWDTEIKLAQMGGFPDYPVFTRKSHTDLSYIACAEKLLGNKQYFYPQFATHNALSLAAVREIASNLGWKTGEYEFQRLHGMGEKLYDQLIGNVPCRIYAPVGQHKDLLAYLIRRLLENGANSSFVNQLMDETIAIEAILADPLQKTRERGYSSNPEISLPENIYGSRKNSPGYDMGNLAHEQIINNMIAKWQNHNWQAGNNNNSKPEPVTSPATGKQVGVVYKADEQTAKQAIAIANNAMPKWNETAISERAVILEKAANIFNDNYDELLALCVQEAGKTLLDAIAEVREAIDFLRYYAEQARKIMRPQLMPGPTGESNELHLHGRGTFVCISPWNFPLAIFTGQVAAALITGNAVIAKPADQTPLIAARAIELMHQAGIPEPVLQLVPGSGRTIGQLLVESPNIAGVCFTGSVAVAQGINRTLAAKDGPIVPLIAETGGQNCMVVDSTALLEQAIDDILLSAFGSAGQRCSALRVLYVQEEIADELIEMLKLAMAELQIGDPSKIDTDIGAVIDEKAKKGLLAHIADMKKNAKLVAGLEAPEIGSFVAPHAFELQDITQLTDEHFGPILHIIRFKGEELEQLPAKINSTGFGLTFGLHSRIEEHWELMSKQVKVGNCYINRNMTGAVVGVQPFGGEGLSGTGPKAGGPHYLLRFVSERTITINTAAIGGNLELLS